MQQASVLCYVLRRICNEDSSRLRAVGELISEHSKVIIFYNFDYELNALRQYLTLNAVEYKEWNGHHHDSLPIGSKWAYLVQYTAGNEGWNCVTCDTIIFYSQNYSYKVMTQAAGRIDRLNTPYQFINYYHLYSDSKIDTAIRAAVTKKKTFNEKVFKFAFEGG
jgi:superfamily II DNA or RNA helicase